MMTAPNFTSRILLCGVLFLIILLAGWILHRIGRPYNQWVFNLHKIATVIWGILMVIVLVQINRLTHPGIYILVSAGISAIALLALLFSGGMMSLDQMQETMLTLHRISTIILLVSYAILFVLIWKLRLPG
jgi:hypothetical protein